MTRSGAGWSPMPALLFALWLGAAPPCAGAPAAKRYALLVGVREYNHARLPDLKYTENDVEELAQLLSARAAGFAKVTLLTSTRGETTKAAQPTGKNVRAALAAMLAKVTKHDTVLVALAGHGAQLTVPDPRDKTKQIQESFFCPADARLNDPATLIGLKGLFKQLDESGAGVKLLFVDACRNEPRLARTFDVDNLPRPPHGTGAIFSCASGQRAFETEKLGKGHGVFFHYVLEGLRGKARNDDDEVTWDRLTEYVKKQVTRQVPRLIGDGAAQSPHVVANLVGESPVLLRLRPGWRALRRGQEMLAAHRYAEASDALSEAVRQAPDEPLAYCYRAWANAQQRKWAGVEDDCDRAVRLGPDLAVAYATRARVRAANRKFGPALDDVRQALRLDANLPAAYRARADLAYFRGDPAGAVKDYTAAIRLDPRDPVAYVERAGAYAKQGNYALAENDCAAALRIDPRCPRAYRDLGIVRIRQKSYERAVEDLNAAVRLDRQDDAGFYWRGVAHHCLKKYDKAVADYTEAIRLAPDDATSYTERGIAYVHLGKSDKALADYTEAIGRGPNDARAYRERGLVYIKLGQYQRAIADFNEAIRLKPDSARAYNERGIAYYKQREYRNAVADFTRAIVLEPNNATLYHNRALAYRGTGDDKHARIDQAAARRLGERD